MVSYRRQLARQCIEEIREVLPSYFVELGYYEPIVALLAEFDALERENEELRRKVDMYEATMTDGEKARAFLASVPFETFHSMDLRDTNPELKAKIDRAFYTVQADDALWYGPKDLPHELWRDVEGYEGLYQVSNLGRVKSFVRVEKILRGKSIGSLTSRRFWSGYVVVFFNVNGKEKFFSVHSLVARMFISNVEGKLEVNHRYGIKMDNRVSELEWATRSENVRHAWRLGLAYSMQRKLTDEQVRYIRENPDCLTGKELAEMFGVTANTIYRVRARKHYMYVK